MLNLFEKQSLRARLIIFLSLTTLVVAVVTTIMGWKTLRKEINTLFDTQQIFFAERLASSKIAEGFHQVQENTDFYFADVDDEALSFAIFTWRGEQIINDDRNGRFIKFAPKEGFDTVISEEYDEDEIETETWRIYWLKHNDVYIAVGQELEYRNDLINKVILSQMGSWLLAFPIMILGIFWIVRREFLSLKRLEQQVKARKPDETELIDETSLPKEVLPLVKGLNRYFKRTQTMLNRERRFTSDAAHELRSPLAGLRVQTELAQMTMNDPEIHAQALNNLTLGIDRISQLIEQLLVLSRLENIEHLDDLEEISWRSLLEQDVSELYTKAERKQTDIHVEIKSEPKQQGKPLLLHLILRNLLENAINYTPNGSLIKLTLSEEKLVIEDNGHGVGEADLLKLGQPFFRPTERPNKEQEEKGSGLGLSIIKRISELHGFTLVFSKSPLGGLKVEIGFNSSLDI